MCMTKQQLIEDNMNLVYFVISKYYPNNIGDEDLVQCGMVGLCTAAERFDESKSKFSTYATNRIRIEIQREFRRRSKEGAALSLDYEYSTEDGETTLGDFIMGSPDVDYVDTTYFYKQLTPLQQTVLDMKRAGIHNAQIARELHFSREYIGRQCRLIRSKWNKYMEQ